MSRARQRNRQGASDNEIAEDLKNQSVFFDSLAINGRKVENERKVGK